jgi:hypothetical protein
MSKPVDANELNHLIDAIDFRRRSLPPYTYDTRKVHEAAIQRIIDELVQLYGAKFKAYSSSSSGSVFAMAGIRATSTSGPLSALLNWMAAARRAIDKFESAQS